MNITIKTGDNYIAGCIPLRSPLTELNKWVDFLREILKYGTKGKRVYLLTLSPQKYSLGYELGSFAESRFGKEKVLINYFGELSERLISEIVNSEEFTRGLLKLVISDRQKSFTDLRFVKSDYDNLSEELITLEDDGTSLYWYNPHWPKDALEETLKKFKSSYD